MSLVLPLARLTLTDPRAAARALLASGFPREHHWTVFLLVISLGGALVAAGNVIAPPEEGEPYLTGMMAAAFIGASIFLCTGVVMLAGRLFGSRCETSDAMLLVLWLELVSVGVQLVLLVVGFLIPGAAAALSLVYLFLFVWVLSAFTAELHALDGVIRGFIGVVAAALGLAFAIALVQAVLIALAG